MHLAWRRLAPCSDALTIERRCRYFGRARELPGVRELFATAAADQAELESYKTVKVTMFDNAPPEYFGNLAEEGEEGRRLLEAERRAEEAGTA